jgi:hypothetical protein
MVRGCKNRGPESRSLPRHFGGESASAAEWWVPEEVTVRRLSYEAIQIDVG